jgi:cytochrome c oxidase subunit II
VDDAHHEQISKWERRWIAFSGLLTLCFVILIAYNIAIEGGHIVQVAGRGEPQALLQSSLFAEPGARITGPGTVQVSLVAQAFSFVPERIDVPVGSEVTFYLTARDVIHGWQVEGTPLNAMVIPGEVATLRFTFSRPGTYRVTCNEYCGVGHHAMLGEIRVLAASQVARAGAEGAPAATADAGVDGAAAYAANCASCHGPAGNGIRGAFPPLDGHAAELAATDRPFLARTLLYGLQGPIIVEGASYNGVMPGWSHLSDEVLAAIANHTLGLGGPEVVPYVADEFALQRQAPRSPTEMLELRREAIGP